MFASMAEKRRFRKVEPSQDYITLLNIKGTIRAWQDLNISDSQALEAIREMLNTPEKEK